MSVRRLGSILTLDALIIAITLTGSAAVTPVAVGCTPYQYCAFLPVVRSTTGAYNYVVNSITLPTSHTQYAIDLNGDGVVDNQLGNIVAALSAQGIDMQSAVDSAINTGTAVELIRYQTSGTNLTDDPDARATLFPGVPTTPTLPNFNGTGVFTVDQSLPPSMFTGVLSSAFFSSTSPVTTTAPVSVSLRMGLFTGSDPVTLTVYGAHVQFNFSESQLVTGALQGSIPVSEVQTTLVPAIASNLTRIVQQSSDLILVATIEYLFDRGGCTNPDGTLAQPNDHVISPCEVASNSTVANLLAPDVQIYDAAGNYAPNPANTHKDSISMAFAFTAVRAQFR